MNEGFSVKYTVLKFLSTIRISKKEEKYHLLALNTVLNNEWIIKDTLASIRELKFREFLNLSLLIDFWLFPQRLLCLVTNLSKNSNVWTWGAWFDHTAWSMLKKWFLRNMIFYLWYRFDYRFVIIDKANIYWNEFQFPSTHTLMQSSAPLSGKPSFKHWSLVLNLFKQDSQWDPSIPNKIGIGNSLKLQNAKLKRYCENCWHGYWIFPTRSQ